MRSLVVTVLAVVVLSGNAVGQSPKQNPVLEQKIRALEQAQVDLLLRKDIAALRSNWAPDFVVNNPFHVVVDAAQGPIAAGTLTYVSFVRDVERVLMHGTTVIVMGSETVVPSESSADAGKTIHRRFTNVWMLRKGRWLLTARQASVICQAEAPPK